MNNEGACADGEVTQHASDTPQNTAPQPVDGWRKAQTIAQIAAAFLTLGAVAAAVFSAVLARRSADRAWTMFELQRRPRLQVSLRDCTPTADGDSLVCNVLFRNTGQSPTDCGVPFVIIDTVKTSFAAANTLMQGNPGPYLAPGDTWSFERVRALPAVKERLLRGWYVHMGASYVNFDTDICYAQEEVYFVRPEFSKTPYFVRLPMMREMGYQGRIQGNRVIFGDR